jgi:hypothetical protein
LLCESALTLRVSRLVLKVGAGEAPARQGGRANYALLAAADGDTGPNRPPLRLACAGQQL